MPRSMHWEDDACYMRSMHRLGVSCRSMHWEDDACYMSLATGSQPREVRGGEVATGIGGSLDAERSGRSLVHGMLYRAQEAVLGRRRICVHYMPLFALDDVVCTPDTCRPRRARTVAARNLKVTHRAHRASTAAVPAAWACASIPAAPGVHRRSARACVRPCDRACVRA